MGISEKFTSSVQNTSHVKDGGIAQLKWCIIL